MFARMPSALLTRWGGIGLVSALGGLPLFASCTSSEDTEPFIPAVQGAKQPAGSGSLLSEDDACGRVRDAAEAAYSRLRCPAPALADCPSYVRPAGGSGCYEYYEDSVAACENAYEDARSCQSLAPCIVAAERNDALETCDLGEVGQGGQAGAASGGAANGGSEAVAGQGGSGSPSDAGAPALGGAGAASAAGGAGGAN